MIRRGPNQTAIIANAGTDSEVIELVDAVTAGVVLPAAFTGTALTFKVSHDGAAFQELVLSDPFPVTQGKSYTFPDEVAPWPFVKIVSGSAEAAERVLYIVSKQ